MKRTFITKRGEKATVTSSTWTTISGLRVTSYRLYLYSPKSGHGWEGLVTEETIRELLPTGSSLAA